MVTIPVLLTLRMKEKDSGKSSNAWCTDSAIEEQEAELEVTEEGEKKP